MLVLVCCRKVSLVVQLLQEKGHHVMWNVIYYGVQEQIM